MRNICKPTRIAPLAIIAVAMSLAAGRVKAEDAPDRTWWSLKPLVRPPVPALTPAESEISRTPIDAFIIAAQRKRGLKMSRSASRGTLVRRLHFDLLGLPPSPALVHRFVESRDPKAYEQLVDQLLASEHYGERWARHWLDIVHYGDTHGYDKDKLRPNAWPYRDYVIRSLNQDKPYWRFVQEQIAGDVIFPDTVDGVVGLGFISAGPWDYVGHAEVPETKIDGRIARHIDRDDMVRATMQTFISMTVGCARCHQHKFDPVSMEDYYSLHAVFAALDRADRTYDPDPHVRQTRHALTARHEALEEKRTGLNAAVRESAGAELPRLEKSIAAERKIFDAFGHHSSPTAFKDSVTWVQIDLLEPRPIDSVVVIGAHDNLNGIGAGFCFPLRYRVELSNDPSFKKAVAVVYDATREDVPNPGCEPQKIAIESKRSRCVRLTVTKLAKRAQDYAFALGELMVLSPEGKNVALGARVTSSDAVESPRWQQQHLVDGHYHGIDVKSAYPKLAELEKNRDSLVADATDDATRAALTSVSEEIQDVAQRLQELPQPKVVYAGTIHHGHGSFRGTGPEGGKPREIRVLARGEITAPAELVGPGTVDIVPGVPARFALPAGHHEGERRRMLAEWLAHKDNPLTWRSIVNRIWQYHMARGIVDTPNDFGRMGALPSHPELLDWLAVGFRDGGQSVKELHRLIVMSAVYRQSSENNESFSRIDSNNYFLWRMQRRRLEAEAIRDSVLAVSGKLDTTMYGPGFRSFVLEQPRHSPHYEYHKHDPEDPSTHRRSIYRFIVRSQPDPFMTTLDCADSSQLVAKRNETLTPLQSLALLNNKFMLAMMKHFAKRLEKDSASVDGRVDRAYDLAFGRRPTDEERALLVRYAEEHGLASMCRIVVNLNEFAFVD